MGATETVRTGARDGGDNPSCRSRNVGPFSHIWGGLCKAWDARSVKNRSEGWASQLACEGRCPQERFLY